MTAPRRSKGFTLPEVLVTIAIVSILAAVLLPALNGQVAKGEASRAANDLLAIQTAVSTFVSDVRRYPGDLEDLTISPTPSNAATDDDINDLAYPSVLTSKWKGPYLAKELLPGSLGLITGYAATVTGTFVKSPSNEYNGVSYVKVTLAPIQESEFNRVDEIIDETVNSGTGQLRFTGPTTSGTLSFYVLPIQ